MSDASPAPEFGPPRRLRDGETAVIRKLLSASPDGGRFLPRLSHALVREMPDGGMGSLQFCAAAEEQDRVYGGYIAEGAFKDADGVPVSVTLNLDQNGELFELDVFKADFSPLIRYPDIDEFEIVERHGQLGFPPEKQPQDG